MPFLPTASSGASWHHFVRKFLKSLRDPEEFSKCQRELAALQKQEDQGKIDLYDVDESGGCVSQIVNLRSWIKNFGTVGREHANRFAEIVP